MTQRTESKKQPYLIRFVRAHGAFYAVAILLTLAVAGLYLLGRQSGSGSAWSGLPLDDNWIHLVYARSLIEKGWFYYNAGVPEAGMSSPFWVILLGLIYGIFTPLGLSPQWCAKGLSLVFACGVPLATYHVARELKIGKHWAWLAGVLVILEPNLAYGNVAGMEVSLFTLLMLAALWLTWRSRYLLAGILLGLSVVTRAEGVPNAVLIGLCALLPAYIKRRQMSLVTSDELKMGLKLFLPSLILGGAWSLYNHSVNGHWLPNTYFVKHNFSLGYLNLENLWNILQGYAGQLAMFRGALLPVILILLAVSFWYFYKSKQIVLALPLVLISIVQLYAFSINVKVEAVGFPWSYFTRRYMDFLLPLWIIQIVLAAGYLWDLASRLQKRWAILATPVLLLAVLLLAGWNFVQLHGYMTEQYSWNTANVEQTNVAMGKWLFSNVPAGASIGVTDAGAMRFWSRADQTIVDFLGLNCWRCMGRPMPELITELRPQYLVVFRTALTSDFPFPYEELRKINVERNTILGGNELVAVKLK